MPDELWVADITYVPTDAGYLYLSVVLDAFSRRPVGWAMADHLRTELVLGALDMAAKQRNSEEMIHHSDQGSQYAAFARRWVQSEIATTTRCVRVFLPPSNANSSNERRMRPDRRPVSASSTSSKGGITRIDCTRPLTISRR